MRKSHGLHVRSRGRRTKKARARGIPSTSRVMARFKKGDKVVINVDHSVQKGQPYQRSDGKTGEVLCKQGSSYVIKVREGNATRDVLSLPVHLKKIGG